ncbi:uncharacterized protein A4U43_C07F19650 [Asparagus officinalis]|uniref:Uncharacterized protein n=1 Tax=Asparagus officinalis TaxID=4686 RepID=A0A5P1EF64_ASPOF|nr:uncharacterized protein A4U43_C07F19650 [Asparagus officinalis]
MEQADRPGYRPVKKVAGEIEMSQGTRERSEVQGVESAGEVLGWKPDFGDEDVSLGRRVEPGTGEAGP